MLVAHAIAGAIAVASIIFAVIGIVLFVLTMKKNWDPIVGIIFSVMVIISGITLILTGCIWLLTFAK
jgi:hypothetical protein